MSRDPTVTISIYGAGDSCVIVDGCRGGGEFHSYERGPRRARWRGDLLAGGDQALRIYAIFDGCWHFSFGQTSKDMPLPPWEYTSSQHPTIAGSALVEIEAPTTTQLTDVWPRDD